jgi:hypothetical protein
MGTTMRILLVASLLMACHGTSQRPAPTKTDVGTAAARTPIVPAGGGGRDRWKGGGVYLDGEPIGVLRYGELPAGLEPIWEVQRHRLPFRPGEEVRYRETRTPRFRITDYLRALGVRLDDVVELHLHGGRDNAVVITRDDLRRHPDDLLFKFAAEDWGKPIPIIRSIRLGTTFDDLRAMSIYVKRTPPHVLADQTLELDGRPVHGIPYHGEPLREGVRIYVDNRLATVLKRNEMPATDTDARWSFRDLLARRGVHTDRLARMVLIHDEERSGSRPWSDVSLAFNSGASGEVVLGPDAQPANAIALFTTTPTRRL